MRSDEREQPLCQCDRVSFPCRHHPNDATTHCGMPAKMSAWPSLDERTADMTGEKAVLLCVACAGAAIGKGWHLRSNPTLWRRG